MILPSDYEVHVEFNFAGLHVDGNIKDGHTKNVNLNGRRYTIDDFGEAIYLDRVWASFYSEEELSKKDIPIEDGYGRIWCREYDGISTIQIDARLPKDWFKAIFDMAIGFTDKHRFNASFRTSEVHDLKPNGGIYTVIEIKFSMVRSVVDGTD